VPTEQVLYDLLEKALEANIESSQKLEQAIETTEAYLENLKGEFEDAVNHLHTRVMRIENHIDRRHDARYAIRSEFV
jgi:hypothetical protein